MADVLSGKIKIRLVRSTIGALPKQRATVRSLGLRKIGSVVEQEANGVILGMVKKVSHLVKVEKIG
ncbi:MAG: 50S ribosomal protein L30 [Spirochaetaceae bacterium]|jgi:large subunit ribosomal protein L30|nr:50S ribosomal protein L30 [Spirochaetaceae bacterium]